MIETASQIEAGNIKINPIKLKNIIEYCNVQISQLNKEINGFVIRNVLTIKFDFTMPVYSNAINSPMFTPRYPRNYLKANDS